MENTRQCSRGDSTRALQGLGLGGAKAKANFLSRAFYTRLVGISSGVLDTQQGSRGDWALHFLELGERILQRIFYTYKSYLHALGSMCLSSGMKTRESVREGIGPSDGLGLGVKSELSSRAFYKLLLGISLGVLDMQQGS